jgi:uncharacterized protein YqeY
MLDELERDIKTALLAGDKETVETLKGVKTAIQYEAVSKKLKSENLTSEQIQAVLTREAKKRQDAADLYKTAGENDRADKELREKATIAKYLPEQMDEAKVAEIVEQEIARLEAPSIKEMGQIIGAVRAKTAGQADGSLIARLVKEKLNP